MKTPQSGEEFNVLDEQKEGECDRCIVRSGAGGGRGVSGSRSAAVGTSPVLRLGHRLFSALVSVELRDGGWSRLPDAIEYLEWPGETSESAVGQVRD